MARGTQKHWMGPASTFLKIRAHCAQRFMLAAGLACLMPCAQGYLAAWQPGSLACRYPQATASATAYNIYYVKYVLHCNKLMISIT